MCTAASSCSSSCELLSLFSCMASSSLSSSSVLSSSSSPVRAFSGSVKVKKIGMIRSIWGCWRRCPTAPLMVHMVRIKARVFSVLLLLLLLSSIWERSRSTALTNKASLNTTLKHPRAFPARFRTTGEVLFLDFVDFSLVEDPPEIKVKQICKTGSCCRVTATDVAPNRPNKSVKTSKQLKTISSRSFAAAIATSFSSSSSSLSSSSISIAMGAFFLPFPFFFFPAAAEGALVGVREGVELRMPSNNRVINRFDVESPILVGIVFTNVRKPIL
mmetsp:Transcript_47033/g.53122  ORF Transcript_47033/g.53122 Transcript_47033/m.53122 type:complete len:273 (+) Transcript_47033:266-1084(+)